MAKVVGIWTRSSDSKIKRRWAANFTSQILCWWGRRFRSYKTRASSQRTRQWKSRWARPCPVARWANAASSHRRAFSTRRQRRLKRTRNSWLKKRKPRVCRSRRSQTSSTSRATTTCGNPFTTKAKTKLTRAARITRLRWTLSRIKATLTQRSVSKNCKRNYSNRLLAESPWNSIIERTRKTALNSAPFPRHPRIPIAR